MYYPCSENKGAGQLRSYCEADLRLCFRIGENPVFSLRGSREASQNFHMANETKYILLYTCEIIILVIKSTSVYFEINIYIEKQHSISTTYTISNKKSI